MARRQGPPITFEGDIFGNARIDPGNHLKKKGKGWPNYPGNDWGAYSGFGERPGVYWD